ncbi:tryptophan-rich sensory protein [Leucobacter exalbidus]|uniref:Tryptophan-rich sensory protein n=1 Tax=Leucobacter exalbidus TaxID=662960 RepID=A0A940SZI3_9MICO|nr:TspO/MBR family protein [Leucobacter exalbidus]MBP1324930.1 tryptophan-rich sensory protein [Leucobacter exalbidus]
MNTRPPAARQIVIGVVLLVVVAMIAFLGSLASMPHTDGWYAVAAKVDWSPPNSVFGPAWSILYFLIAVAGWMIWRNGWRENQPNAAQKTLTIYTVQLALNAIWTPIFFAGYPLIGEPAWWIALVVIIALILCVIWLAVSAWKWSKPASLLMIPYVLWLVFASSLNAGVIALN